MKSRLGISIVAAVMFLLIAVPVSAGGALAKSRFDVNPEKWQTSFSAFPAPEDADWSTDGYIYKAETVLIGGVYEFYFQAPPKFLGDKRSAYKGALAFDIGWDQQGANPASAAGVVYMHGNGVVLRYRYGPVGRGALSKHVVPLTKEGWEQTSDNHQVTGAELKAVVGGLTAINVLLELDLSDDGLSTFSLDNVKLKAPQ
jgi:hypothetical protein